MPRTPMLVNIPLSELMRLRMETAAKSYFGPTIGPSSTDLSAPGVAQQGVTAETPKFQEG
jgi:hypothetical protein